MVEGIHYGSVVVLVRTARSSSSSATSRPLLPRSALKPSRPLAMVRAGLPLDGELLSLAPQPLRGGAHLAAPGASRHRRTRRGRSAQRPRPAVRPGRPGRLGA
ncbi:asparaginase [Streptomyces sp. F001]|uniref:asparaginase n=1 Tax=Streptomyces sp. F001 TaxID=1510026 RepID=UPI001F0DF608|nr:asparaginase [Streptomyces sp. F001]